LTAAGGGDVGVPPPAELMRAAVTTAPGVIRVEQRPRPAIGAGELLVRVRGCGLCGSDLAKLRAPARVPAVLGHEVVGDVVGVGAGVDDFRSGDRVVVAHHVPCLACHYCRRGSVSMCRRFKASNLDPGGFAEYVRVPPENVRHATFRVPPGVPDAVAAFTEPLACCLRAVRRSGLGPGDTALVVGLGAIGGLILLAGRRDLARALGASAAVDPADAGEALRELTAGRGADGVILTVGAPAVVRQALEWTRDGGQVHLFVGEGEGSLPVGEIYHRELTLTATYSASPADLAEAFELVASGAVRVAELCSHRLPLERLADAARLMERREALKVYVEVGGEGA
jgi:L-iditol 2-dehydrogenase